MRKKNEWSQNWYADSAIFLLCKALRVLSIQYGSIKFDFVHFLGAVLASQSFYLDVSSIKKFLPQLSGFILNFKYKKKKLTGSTISVSYC